MWCYLKTHKTELSFWEGIWFQAQGWSWVPRRMKCPLLPMQELLGEAHRTHSPLRHMKQGRNPHFLPQEGEQGSHLSPACSSHKHTRTRAGCVAILKTYLPACLYHFTLNHSSNLPSQEERGKFIIKIHSMGVLGR